MSDGGGDFKIYFKANYALALLTFLENVSGSHESEGSGWLTSTENFTRNLSNQLTK